MIVPGGSMEDTITVPAKVDGEDTTQKRLWARAAAIRLADEGVPIGAIVRSLRVPYGGVRSILKDAQARGVILVIPRDDWPPGTRREERRPDCVPLETHPEAMVSTLMRVFGVTTAQATILASLLRRKEMTKSALHLCIQREGAPPTDQKIVDVLICHLRKRLPKDIKIETLWGRGYYISTHAKNIAYARLANG